MSTAISWVRNPDGTPGRTWDPVGGCTKCSPGCDNCWALRDIWRLAHHPNAKVSAPVAGLVEKGVEGNLFWTGVVREYPERLRIPMVPRKPITYFVGSKTDLFHEHVGFDFIHRVMCAIRWAPRHRFIILTKRISRMKEFWEWEKFRMDRESDYIYPAPNNAILMATVCNQAEADEKIPDLLSIEASAHGVSIEPMLESVALKGPGWSYFPFQIDGPPEYQSRLCEGLDWVIVGGESGARSRPCDVAWIGSIVHQCKVACVPVFVKQLGSTVVDTSGCMPGALKLMKGKCADPALWPEWIRVQEFPEVLR